MPQPGERLDRAEGTQPYKPESRALPPWDVQIQQDWNSRNMSTPATREHIESLKASILARIKDGLPGLFDPIKIRYTRATGTAELVDGECRLTAYRQLWKAGTEAFIPCTVTDGSEAELRAASLIGNSGLPLTPLEIGLQCKRLNSGYLWSVQKIAEHICKPARFVTEAIALHNAPEEAKALVAAGAVTPGAVRHELKEAAKNGKPPESIVEPLRKAAAARPEPKQARMPDVPAKPAKPAARPKKPSPAEQVAKTAPKLLDLADAMYRLIMDPQIPRSELRAAAEPYGKARGL